MTYQCLFVGSWALLIFAYALRVHRDFHGPLARRAKQGYGSSSMY